MFSRLLLEERWPTYAFGTPDCCLSGEGGADAKELIVLRAITTSLVSSTVEGCGEVRKSKNQFTKLLRNEYIIINITTTLLTTRSYYY